MFRACGKVLKEGRKLLQVPFLQPGSRVYKCFLYSLRRQPTRSCRIIVKQCLFEPSSEANFGTGKVIDIEIGESIQLDRRGS